MFDILSLLMAEPDMIEVRIALSLAGIAAFTYYDLTNNKNIPSELCYGFLAVAILFSILFPAALPAGIALVIMLSLFTVPFYFAGQLGGADIFALAALALLLPVLPNPLLSNRSQPGSLAFPVLFNTLLYAFFFFIIYMFYSFVPKIFSLLRKKKLSITPQKIAYSVFYSLSYAVILFLLFNLKITVSIMIILGMLFAAFATIFFSLFRDEINSTLVSELELSKIVEEDVLATEKMDPALVSKYHLPRLLKAKDLATLKKISKEHKLAKFPIYTGYPPFMPFIAIGFLLAIVFGNVFV